MSLFQDEIKPNIYKSFFFSPHYLFVFVFFKLINVLINSKILGKSLKITPLIITIKPDVTLIAEESRPHLI